MAGTTLEVSVNQGKLRGVIVENTTGGQYIAFRGVPYATPPLGPLRFKDPLPAQSWTGVRNASNFGNMCLQFNLVTWQVEGTEDCLYLNIYTTTLNPPKKQSVMVFFHGGGFFQGSADDILYGPDYLVKKDIVLVTVNYRLHVFGFFNLEHEVAPGNQGLKDQVLALQWVQQNIEAFGGNKNNVTIFGQSAGASSVHFLCISPMAQGLFHKAIAQSGVALNPWAITQKPQKNALQLASLLGENSTDPKTVVEFLRKVDSKKLIQALPRLLPPMDKLYVANVFLPAPDPTSSNPVLPNPHVEIINAQVKVPLLLGSNSREGIMWFYYNKNFLKKNGSPGNMLDVLNKQFDGLIFRTVREKLKELNISLTDFKRYYFGEEIITEAHLMNYVDMISDMCVNEQLNEVVNALAARQTAPVYLYRFSHESNRSLSKMFFENGLQGACHCDELPFLFYPKIMKSLGIKECIPGTIDYKVMTYLTQMWTDFAKTGNPTPAKTDLIPVIWEPVKRGDTQNILEISRELRVVTLRKSDLRYDWKNIKNKL